MQIIAEMISELLQCGVPLSLLVSQYCYRRFGASGTMVVIEKDVPEGQEVMLANSWIDYLFRALAVKYLNADPHNPTGNMEDASRDAGEEGL